MNLFINRKIAILIFSLLIFIVLLVGCTTPVPVPINHHPIITSFPITLATVNETYAYNVEATDPDGDTLTFSLTTKPTGMTINSTTGLINWTPTSTGDYDVIVEVSDNGSPVESTTQNFTIHVGQVSTNQAPTISSTPITSATVNQAYAYNVDATDPDGDTLTYFLTISPAGMTINSTTGLINWIPTATGYYDVTVEVSDNGSPVKSVTQSFTIHVGQAPVNQPPTITSTPITTATVDQAYSYNVNAIDPDGDTLTYSLTTKPAGMTINSWNGIINWTPTALGDYDVIVEVSDNGSPVESTTQSFIIHVGEAPINQAPIITSTPITTATVDQAYTYNVNATDPDGDTLTYSLTTKPTGMTINSWNGLINWTPTSTGNYDVTVKVSDNGSPVESTTQSFTIHVKEEQEPSNHAPIITSTPTTSATVDQAYAYNVDATDPDGDTLIYSLTTKPTGMTINSSTGLINWTPTSTGNYDVTVRVSDGELFDTQSFTITVNVGVTPNLKLTPSSQTVSQGSQATINVVVEDVTDLRGASVTLNFDASKLQYSSSTAGSFIPNATLMANSTNGSVNLDIAGLGASGYHGGLGTGTIITVKFDTIAIGNTNITFGATTLRDKDNNNITHTKSSSGCSVNIN